MTYPVISTLWFGNTSKFVAAPVPDLPFDAPANGFSESFQSEAGGAFVQTSQAESKQYQFSFGMGSAADLGLYRRFKVGSFGSGLLNFANPFAFTSNLFSPVWAEPGLIEGGDWPSNYDADPTFSTVSANSYSQPLRKATYSITQAANTAPTYQSSTFIIPIPPTHTLHLGCSGAATGTAVVHVEAHNIAGASSAGSNLTLLTDTSSTRLNASFSGASYDYVAIDFRRTSSASSTLTITSMLAQLWLTGVTPTLTGNHRPGDGHTGLRFSGSSMGLSHRLMTGSENFSGAAFSLTEVGAWIR
jgi:hypothetical protein